MAKKNGKANKELICVTIDGVQKLLTRKQLDKEGRVFTDQDFERLRKEGKKLFRTDKEFEEFQKFLRESRQRG